MENIINKINVIGKIKFKKENFKFLHMDKNKWIHAVHVKKNTASIVTGMQKL